MDTSLVCCTQASQRGSVALSTAVLQKPWALKSYIRGQRQKAQMKFNIPVITLLSSSGGSLFLLSDGSKMKAEASSYPARREVQGPVKVRVLSAVSTRSLGAAKREISMPEKCHGHNNKRRFKTRGSSCHWVEQVGKEVTLAHCLKQLLTSKCFVLDDAFFTKRELKKISKLQAGSVPR